MKRNGRIIINGVEVDLKALKNASTSHEEETQTIKKSLSGNALIVEDVAANVSIKPASITTIEVTIIGPKSFVNDISVSETGGGVTIKGRNGGNGSSTTVIQSGGGVIRVSQSGRNGVQVSSIGGMILSFLGRGSIVINDSGDPEITIDIRVPVGTDLDLSGISGKVTVGDVMGSLRAHVSGSGSIHAVSAKGLHGRVSGSGDLTVANVTGDVSVRVSGSGDVNINGGQIEELEAEASGSGDIEVRATAQSADLSASGSGDIYVARVIRAPRKHASGSGDIKVGRIG